MNYKMFELFGDLPDPRRSQGIRHQLDDILIIAVMAILSGHNGIRGFTRFAKSNETELTQILRLKHGIPRYNSFLSVFNAIDQTILAQRFTKWVKMYLPEFEDEHIALDGKSIRATVQNQNSSTQDFVAVVNAFGHQSGVVYGMQAYRNGKSGEGDALRALITRLGMKEVTFTMDALHTKKNF